MAGARTAPGAVFDLWLSCGQLTGDGVYFLTPSPEITLTMPAYVRDAVTVTAYDAAGTTASCRFTAVVRDGSRTADFYPSPVTDYLSVRTGEAASSASVRVQAPNGGTVLTESGLTITPFEPARIDMTSLPGGMYRVTLSYPAPDGTARSVSADIAKL